MFNSGHPISKKKIYIYIEETQRQAVKMNRCTEKLLYDERFEKFATVKFREETHKSGHNRDIQNN